MTNTKPFIVTEETLAQEREQGVPLYEPRTGTRYEIMPDVFAVLRRLSHGLQKKYLKEASSLSMPMWLDEMDTPEGKAAKKTWEAARTDLFARTLAAAETITRPVFDERMEVLQVHVRQLRAVADIEEEALPAQYALAKMICDLERVATGGESAPAKWPDADDITPKVIARINADFTRARSATAPQERPMSPDQVRQVQEVLLPLLGSANGKPA